MKVTKAFKGSLIGHGDFFEAGLSCPNCARKVVVLIPPEAVEGKRAPILGEHKCTACGSSLYTMTLSVGRAVIGTGYQVSPMGIMISNGFQMEFDGTLDASFEAAAQRLEMTPLVVGPGPDGMPKLYRPEELA